MLKKKTAVLTAAVLTVVLSLNLFSVSAKKKLPEISLQCGYAQENAETTVSLNVNEKISVSAFSFEIFFDPKKLSFEDASMGSALNYGNFYCNGEYSDDCVRIVWSDSEDANVSGELAKLKFRTKNAETGTKTGLYIGYSSMGNEKFEEIAFDTVDSEIEIMQDYIWGDANGDGETTAADAVAINKYNISRELYPINNKYVINADIDYNNIINLSDSDGVVNYIMKQNRKGGAI
ncbi:cohesin domain-containing protein [Porcipelethomonas sp.]|uniref:cohesin domain-containing protein n=1 Tax=Porcipelethomonas sp. TaxID=2981675 RepID=UPI003EF61926